MIQSTERSFDRITTAHLLNISGKEVTAFNLSIRQTLPDGKIFTPSAHMEDTLGEYLATASTAAIRHKITRFIEPPVSKSRNMPNS